MSNLLRIMKNDADSSLGAEDYKRKKKVSKMNGEKRDTSEKKRKTFVIDEDNEREQDSEVVDNDLKKALEESAKMVEEPLVVTRRSAMTGMILQFEVDAIERLCICIEERLEKQCATETAMKLMQLFCDSVDLTAQALGFQMFASTGESEYRLKNCYAIFYYRNRLKLFTIYLFK